MAKSTRRRKSVVKGAGDDNPPPQKVVLRGMADLEKTLARRFQERKKQFARLAEANASLRDKLLGVFGDDPAWAACSRRARRVARASLASRRISISKALPRKVGAGVFVGINGGARFLPFDYSWTGSYGYDTAKGIPDLGADADSGDMHVNVNTSIFEGGLDGYAAVGIFFRLPSLGFFRVPVFPLAILSVSANPSVYFGWEAFFDPATQWIYSGGFIGLLVQRYDWTEGLASPLSTATLVAQEISLWKDNSLGLNGSGWNNPWVSVPLSASFLVDSGHWYALWVWCGTHDWGAGPYHRNGSWALSELRANVPSINWQFCPMQALPARP